MKKLLTGLMVLVLGASLASAAAMRPLYTMENAFPEQLHADVGLTVLGFALSDVPNGLDGKDLDFFRYDIDARLGLADSLALQLDVPFLTWDDTINDEGGISDLGLELQWLAWEDIFDYVWIIPHAKLYLPTGDEDKYLGTGDTDAKLGVSIGTTVEDDWHFAIDASWIKTDLRDATNGQIEEHGAFLGSVFVGYDLFSDHLDGQGQIFAEGTYFAYSADPDEHGCARAHAGLSYTYDYGLTATIYAGGQSGDGEGGYGGIRLTYAF